MNISIKNIFYSLLLSLFPYFHFWNCFLEIVDSVMAYTLFVCFFNKLWHVPSPFLVGNISGNLQWGFGGRGIECKDVRGCVYISCLQNDHAN